MSMSDGSAEATTHSSSQQFAAFAEGGAFTAFRYRLANCHVFQCTSTTVTILTGPNW